MPKIFKVVDKSDSQVLDNGILPNTRFFGLLSGKTGASKTSLIINMLLSKEFPYHNQFEGENIYIFSGSINSDEKIKLLVKMKEIPESNLYGGYSDDDLNSLYDKLEDDYTTAMSKDEPIVYPLIILDDLAFSGNLHKKFNALTRLAQNSRKLAISVLVTTQYYFAVIPSVRENISFAIVYKSSQKNYAMIEEEHNYLGDRKLFLKMMNEELKFKRDFIVINYDNDGTDIYLNKEFEPIFK